MSDVKLDAIRVDIKMRMAETLTAAIINHPKAFNGSSIDSIDLLEMISLGVIMKCVKEDQRQGMVNVIAGRIKRQLSILGIEENIPTPELTPENDPNPEVQPQISDGKETEKSSPEKWEDFDKSRKSHWAGLKARNFTSMDYDEWRDSMGGKQFKKEYFRTDGL